MGTGKGCKCPCVYVSMYERGQRLVADKIKFCFEDGTVTTGYV